MEVLGERHPDTLTSMNNLAYLYQSQGDYEQALPLYQKANTLSMEVLGERHPDTLRSMNNLALLYDSQGDYEQALPLYLKANTLSMEVLGDRHPKTLISLSNLAAFFVTTQDENMAAQYFLEWTVQSNAFLQVMEGFDARTRRAFLKTGYDSSRDGLFSFFSEHPSEEISELLPFALMRKGLLFQVAARLHRIGKNMGGDSKLGGRLESLAKARATVSRLAQQANAGRLNHQRLQEENAGMERLEQEIGYALSRENNATYLISEQVLSALPRGSVLVDFQIYQRYDVTQKPGEEWQEWQLLALLADPKATQPVQLIKLGPIAPLYKDLRALGKAASNPKSKKTLQEAAGNLYQKLWQPLTPYLVGKQRTYVVPDGQLHLLPWDALMDAQGRYLADTIEVAVLATGHDLLALPEDTVQPGKPHLIYAPNYDYDLAADQRFDPRADVPRPWTPLAGAEWEGQRLRERFAQHGLDVVTAGGDDAREDWVTAIASPQVLHIATHGAYKGGQPQGRGKQREPRLIRDMEQVDFLTGEEILDLNRPMLHSVLALTGANGVARGLHAPDETDGLLSALEVLSMDLRGTKLVVLSACETGVGSVHNGDGVYSLNRAFMEAGARNVLATLWAVDDEATAVFMDCFYDFYLKGDSPRQALKTTKALFRESTRYNHPYYWAPFTLIGPD